MMEEDQYVESFPDKSNMPLCGERVLTTPSYFAYVKIAEGCDNRCSYCAIPLIRGGYRSRTMESIEEECRALVADGAKELILIAQDTSRYGIDLYGEYSLAKLMRRLCQIDGPALAAGVVLLIPTPSPTSCWRPWPAKRKSSPTSTCPCSTPLGRCSGP